jgi:hypothetical protein
VWLIKPEEIEGECKYTYGEYYCTFERTSLINKDTTLTITVKHKWGRNDTNVIALQLYQSPIFPIHLSFIEKFPNLQRLKISRSSWNFSKPLENCENFTQFELIDLDLAFIPKNFFTKCTKLKLLIFTKTFILSYMTDDLFVNQKQLEKLAFMDEIIPHLKENYFTSLVSLKMLTFDTCKILNIDEDLFKNLRKLHTLEMSGVTVDQFPRKFFDSLENLEKLLLIENSGSISEINESFFLSLRTLKKLNFIQVHVCIKIRLTECLDLCIC